MRLALQIILIGMMVVIRAYAGHNFVLDHQYFAPAEQYSVIPNETITPTGPYYLRDKTFQSKDHTHLVAPQQKQFVAADFDSIEAYGDLDLVLIGGNRANSLQYTDASNQPLFAKLIGKTLSLCRGRYCDQRKLCANCHCPSLAGKRAVAVIHVKDLEHFTFVGKGKVVGNNLYSKSLAIHVTNCGLTRLSGNHLHVTSLHADGAGRVELANVTTPKMVAEIEGQAKVYLTGISDIKDLTMKGHGYLNMLWLNSCHLHVHGSENGEAFLAGRADQVYADLKDNAFLDARFLRANAAYINTAGTSRADIWPINSLSALADERSNIYYYHEPKVIVGNYMKQNGAVLSMVNVDNFYCRGFPGLYRHPACQLRSVSTLAGRDDRHMVIPKKRSNFL